MSCAPFILEYTEHDSAGVVDQNVNSSVNSDCCCCNAPQVVEPVRNVQLKTVGALISK